MTEYAKIGVVTISDRASQGVYEDLSGPAVVAALDEFLTSPFEPERRLIEDDQRKIEKTLIELADKERCHLIITTGGTGPSARDVTPEATVKVCDKMLPGFGELMRKVSLEKVPTAILSRQEAGLRKQSLIINLPGSPRAIRECLIAVFPAVPYCLDLIEGPRLETDPKIVEAFRPQNKG